MNYQVRQSDCKFYVNEKERTIACVITQLGDIPVRELLNVFWTDLMVKYDTAPISFLSSKNKWNDMCELKNSYVGVAKCHPEDEWNEETGKLIAFSRAKTALYKAFFNKANELIKKIDHIMFEYIEGFNRFGLSLDNSKSNLEKRIRAALYPNEPDPFDEAEEEFNDENVE